MKKMVLGLLLAGMVMMAGCGSSERVIERETAGSPAENSARENAGGNSEALTENGSEKEAVHKGFVFKYKDVTVSVDENMKPILEKLGDPDSYFEAASCAFEGLDKIYTYSDFEIDTYPQGEEDFVSAIILKNDVVTTAEGIYIGCTKEDVTAAYGTDYAEEGNMLVYEKDGMKLCFLCNNDEVTSIQYFSTILDE